MTEGSLRISRTLGEAGNIFNIQNDIFVKSEFTKFRIPKNAEIEEYRIFIDGKTIATTTETTPNIITTTATPSYQIHDSMHVSKAWDLSLIHI